MNRHWIYKFLALAAGGLYGLAGCGGSGSGEATGSLSVGVSDGPLHDATKVCIAFTEIEVKREGAPPKTIVLRKETDEPLIINLLEYQGAHAASLLFDYKLPAGKYQWLRLGVDADLGGTGANGATALAENRCDGEGSFVAMKSTESTHNLFIPSGAQTGLKFVGGFIVPVNDVVDLTAEWNLPLSIPEPPGLSPDVILRPVVRLVDNTMVGTLAGRVDDSLIPGMSSCEPSVYLYDGAPTSEPIDGSAEPLAMAMVNERIINLETEYHYEIGFLLAGEYKVAFTCDDGTTLTPDTGSAAIITQQSIDNDEVIVVDLP